MISQWTFCFVKLVLRAILQYMQSDIAIDPLLSADCSIWLADNDEG